MLWYESPQRVPCTLQPSPNYHADCREFGGNQTCSSTHSVCQCTYCDDIRLFDGHPCIPQDSIWIWETANLGLTGEIPYNIGEPGIAGAPCGFSDDDEQYQYFLDPSAVFFLDMSGNNITGGIPISLANFSQADVRLYNNNLSGPIPPEICAWVESNMYMSLSYLVDGNPELIDTCTGYGPQGDCDWWSEVYLGWDCTEFDSGNTGCLANGCYSIELTTEINDVTSWTLPAVPFPVEIGRLVNLEELQLSNQELSGDLPHGIGQLTNLTKLELTNILLDNSPTIPVEIGNLVNLTRLKLDFCRLTGIIPESIGFLTNLTDLRLNNNQLTGTVQTRCCSWYGSLGRAPGSFGSLINLTYLDLSHNQLTDFDEWNAESMSDYFFGIFAWRTIIYYEETGRTVIGKFFHGPDAEADCMDDEGSYNAGGAAGPEVITTCFDPSDLFKDGLNFSHNEIDWEIQPEIGNLTNLSSLILNNNQFPGDIPLEIGNFTNLDELDLSYNNLGDNDDGNNIPDEICNLDFSAMSLINLEGNTICWPYPECIEDYMGYQDTVACSCPGNYENVDGQCLDECLIELGDCPSYPDDCAFDCSCCGCDGVPNSGTEVGCDGQCSYPFLENDECDVCDGNCFGDVGEECFPYDCFGNCITGDDECGVCGGMGPEDCYECDGSCSTTPGCEQDECGECGGDGTEENYDCEGNCTAELDECGVCGGTGPDDYFDCEGNCIDTYDDCGVCGGTNSPNTGTCDCTGIPGGSAVEDCIGMCDGDAEYDECGDCNGIGFLLSCGELEPPVCMTDMLEQYCTTYPDATSCPRIDECGTCAGEGPQHVCWDNERVCDESECIPRENLNIVTIEGTYKVNALTDIEPDSYNIKHDILSVNYDDRNYHVTIPDQGDILVGIPYSVTFDATSMVEYTFALKLKTKINDAVVVLQSSDILTKITNILEGDIPFDIVFDYDEDFLKNETGCVDPLASNYNGCSTWDDGTFCTETYTGCNDPTACTCDNPHCKSLCTDDTGVRLCGTADEYKCTNTEGFFNPNPLTQYDEVMGCTYPPKIDITFEYDDLDSNTLSWNDEPWDPDGSSNVETNPHSFSHSDNFPGIIVNFDDENTGGYIELNSYSFDIANVILHECTLTNFAGQQADSCLIETVDNGIYSSIHVDCNHFPSESHYIQCSFRDIVNMHNCISDPVFLDHNYQSIEWKFGENPCFDLDKFKSYNSRINNINELNGKLYTQVLNLHKGYNNFTIYVFDGTHNGPSGNSPSVLNDKLNGAIARIQIPGEYTGILGPGYPMLGEECDEWGTGWDAEIPYAWRPVVMGICNGDQLEGATNGVYTGGACGDGCPNFKEDWTLEYNGYLAPFNTADYHHIYGSDDITVYYGVNRALVGLVPPCKEYLYKKMTTALAFNTTVTDDWETMGVGNKIRSIEYETELITHVVIEDDELPAIWLGTLTDLELGEGYTVWTYDGTRFGYQTAEPWGFYDGNEENWNVAMHYDSCGVCSSGDTLHRPDSDKDGNDYCCLYPHKIIKYYQIDPSSAEGGFGTEVGKTYLPYINLCSIHGDIYNDTHTTLEFSDSCHGTEDCLGVCHENIEIESAKILTSFARYDKFGSCCLQGNIDYCGRCYGDSTSCELGECYAASSAQVVELGSDGELNVTYQEVGSNSGYVELNIISGVEYSQLEFKFLGLNITSALFVNGEPENFDLYINIEEDNQITLSSFGATELFPTIPANETVGIRLYFDDIIFDEEFTTVEFISNGQRAYIDNNSINTWLNTQELTTANDGYIYTTPLTYYGCPDELAVNHDIVCSDLGEGCISEYPAGVSMCIFSNMDCTGTAVASAADGAFINTCGICVGPGTGGQSWNYDHPSWNYEMNTISWADGVTEIGMDCDDHCFGVHRPDCMSVCNGEATRDCADNCCGGTSPNTLCAVYDCMYNPDLEVNDPINIASCGGTLEFDDCNDCGGTCHAEDGCACDCPPEMGGYDVCGVCGGDGTSCITGCMDESACNFDPLATIPSGCTFAGENFDCQGNCLFFRDCLGECNGDAIEDCAGVCEGLAVTCPDNNACNTGLCEDCEYAEENYDCDGNCTAGIDCAGECGGSLVDDDCGVCGGDGSTCGEGCMDPLACNHCSVCDVGTATCIYADENYDCDGNCTIDSDCNGDCGGSAVVDECGVCDGGDTDNLGCGCFEPAAVFYCFDDDGDGFGSGTPVEYCLVDVPDEQWVTNCDDDCECEDFEESYDCLGVCCGTAELDQCGVCNGDGQSCVTAGCDDPVACNYNQYAISNDGSCVYAGDIYGDITIYDYLPEGYSDDEFGFLNYCKKCNYTEGVADNVTTIYGEFLEGIVDENLCCIEQFGNELPNINISAGALHPPSTTCSDASNPPYQGFPCHIGVECSLGVYACTQEQCS